jgi:hypothetical protein
MVMGVIMMDGATIISETLITDWTVQMQNTTICVLLPHNAAESDGVEICTSSMFCVSDGCHFTLHNALRVRLANQGIALEE